MGGPHDKTGDSSPKKKFGRPFPKGVSGNPGGKAKGLPARIRELTTDGDQIIAHFVAAMQGARSVHDRSEAARWLADRLWGKAPERVEMEISEVEKRIETYSAMSREQLLAAVQAALTDKDDREDLTR